MIPWVEYAAAMRDAIATLEAHGHAASAEMLRVHGVEMLRLARHGSHLEPVSAEAETVAIENPSRVHG